VLAEHAARGPIVHGDHYTVAFDPQARYVVSEWTIRPALEGEAMVVGNFATDPRFANLNPHERAVFETGVRAGLLVPLALAGRIVGVLAATARTPDAYGEGHLGAARQVADLIAPFIQSVVLLQRERRRRRRLRAVAGLPRAFAASLSVRDVFDRLAGAVRPIANFDVMGVGLLSASGREIEALAEVDTTPNEIPPWRMPLENFSFSAKIDGGETILIHDAAAELDPSLPGDRMMLDGGGRAAVGVPLWFGERVGGALWFGKRQPHWFDQSDVEIATAVAAQVVLALQHQRLAEDQRRLALAEGRARRLEQRLESLRDELGERYGFDRIIGRSPALRAALAGAAKVAATETTVLITGESGTGKELVARAIHHAGPRADGPFVAVNCAALPETLLESELFGHERGAFTGADRQRPGRFELAAGGTLFLDEIGDVSSAVQAKLLRVIQEREFQRVGGTATLRADVRLIAATNRDLEHAVAAGRFRADLYYRLNVFTVLLPPLRDRADDVLFLADHFVRTLGAKLGKGEPGLSRAARDALLAHPWPGNIRELQNAIERALIVSDGGLVTAGQLGLERAGARLAPAQAAPSGAETPAEPLELSLPEWERRLVCEALEKAKGNKSRAAQILGLTRSQLYTRLKRHGLET
jgi:transcriptional regulator with GAF, ATPase, and Fis domain